MDGTAAVDSVLAKLELKFEHEPVGEDVVHYSITIDEDEDEVVDALLYHTEEGPFLRLYAYVDEVDEDNTLEQLKLVLVLNGDLPTGAFCLDPEEGVIDVTVNLPVSEMTPDLLSWMIEFCFIAREMYVGEAYPAPEDEIAQG
jgi:hypothetical protein